MDILAKQPVLENGNHKVAFMEFSHPYLYFVREIALV